MSAFQSHALDAIAFQLVAALEQYDEATGTMIAAWPDLEHYRSVSEQIEKIRMYSSALPDARVQWVELLIAHSELVHFLWRAQYGDSKAAREQIESVRDHHGDAIAALRNRCLRVIARSQQHGGGERLRPPPESA
jgi:hypothetical protein